MNKKLEIKISNISLVTITDENYNPILSLNEDEIKEPLIIMIDKNDESSDVYYRSIGKTIYYTGKLNNENYITVSGVLEKVIEKGE